MVDVRLLHHFEELPGIGRQAFDIAPLSLGIDRVEGERGFARAGQAGDDHQPVAWDIHVDILQIVLAGAANRDRFLHRRSEVGRTGETLSYGGFLRAPASGKPHRPPLEQSKNICYDTRSRTCPPNRVDK
jgi:hypothetical protein